MTISHSKPQKDDNGKSNVPSSLLNAVVDLLLNRLVARSLYMSWKDYREWFKYEGGIYFFLFAAKKPSCNKASGDVGSKSNTFVDGTSNFKLDTIKTHEMSR